MDTAIEVLRLLPWRKPQVRRALVAAPLLALSVGVALATLLGLAPRHWFLVAAALPALLGRAVGSEILTMRLSAARLARQTHWALVLLSCPPMRPPIASVMWLLLPLMFALDAAAALASAAESLLGLGGHLLTLSVHWRRRVRCFERVMDLVHIEGALIALSAVPLLIDAGVTMRYGACLAGLALSVATTLLSPDRPPPPPAVPTPIAGPRRRIVALVDQ